MPLHIGVTECSSSGPRSHKKTMEYINWLKSVEREGIELNCHIIATSKASQNIYPKVDLARLDAIVFSGGDDISPENLGLQLSEDEIKSCNLIPEPERDTIEFHVAESCLKLNLPILGICRGMQVVNVVLGGDVYLDHTFDYPNAFDHQRLSQEESSYHPIKTQKASFLNHVIGQTEGNLVSSRHHQSVKAPGKGMRIAATAQDGVIEALESVDRSAPIWLVQWHPERMWVESRLFNKPKLDNVCSKGLADSFVRKVWEHKG